MRIRSKKLEILDQDCITPSEINTSLDFMVKVNKYLGGSKAIINYFETYAKEDALRIVDLGCGSGDIPFALVQWAKKRNKKISIIALDINPHCLQYAQSHYATPEIEYKNHSAFEFNTLGQFDYAISSMFFHHLTDEKIIQLLQLMQEHCKQGFIINDLERHALAYMGVGLLATTTLNKIVLHDSTLSVARAFRENNWSDYAHKAGIKNALIYKAPMYRIMMGAHV
ncbi:MAG: 2-polyprenyl-3-methyl-5-hydroxy-6-metoxy-1,4-benzoquinol methylase [Candidatus Omnitrophota bacterium]|jgi:2-polyprenyl-3-methyl-5-hydroxy-6-metoxy-1,4-benzoquinol methylase